MRNRRASVHASFRRREWNDGNDEMIVGVRGSRQTKGIAVNKEDQYHRQGDSKLQNGIDKIAHALPRCKVLA